MSFYGFMAFCAVYLLAVATPGPGVAAVLTRSLAHGLRGAPPFIAGFLLGDLLWFAGAAAGLAALAQTAQSVFLVVRYAGPPISCISRIGSGQRRLGRSKPPTCMPRKDHCACFSAVSR